jgi:NitT/TauT family transport system ATP-binding protein
MTPGPKLTTRNLCKHFRKGGGVIEALQGVSIDVHGGEFVSVVGASGCGKTTFLRLIGGLTTPSSGFATIDDKQVTRPGDKVAFVFQQDGLLPWRNVLQNTVFGAEIQRKNKRASRQLAQEFLKLTGLSGFDSSYPHELSGGMRQRVNLARALTAGAGALLMDEPFAALDAQTRVIMQDELMRICQETRKTVLLVTHQIDEAVYLSDRVLVFTARPGRLKEEVVIGLPRPRNLGMKFTPEFTRHCDHIWRLIEEEVRAAMGQELKFAAEARH